MGKFKDLEIKIEEALTEIEKSLDTLDTAKESILDPFNNITNLASSVFSANVEKGFWENGVNEPNGVPLKIALMHSELSEALEAYRANIKDDKLPQYDGLWVELADTVIRILDLCGAHEIPIGQIIKEKLEYNKSRPYKHGKAF